MSKIRQFFINVVNTPNFKFVSLLGGLILIGYTTKVEELKNRLCFFIGIHRLHIEFALGIANYRALDEQYGLS
tara:strand:+ start:515 stop:733 length:219 start_codon:yes stop_codon:yes gene_type:complete